LDGLRGASRGVSGKVRTDRRSSEPTQPFEHERNGRSIPTICNAARRRALHYRQLLADLGALLVRGQPSATSMGCHQIEAAPQAMVALGWPRGATGSNSILDRCHRERRPQWSKIVALW
jgi:hypothetical protein